MGFLLDIFFVLFQILFCKYFLLIVKNKTSSLKKRGYFYAMIGIHKIPGKMFCGHLLQNDTEYSRQEQGSEMEVKHRQGYQRGGHVYNNECNRNFPSRIDITMSE